MVAIGPGWLGSTRECLGGGASLVEPSDTEAEVAFGGEVREVVAHELGDDFEGEQVEHGDGVQVP